MTATIELNSARRKLQGALGESSHQLYFHHMKNWFRKRITEEEFDLEARKLLAPEHSHLHNEFLLAILNKCQTLANFTGPATAKAPPSTVELLSPRKYSADPSSDRLRRGRIQRQPKSSQPTFDQRFVPVNVANVAPNLDQVDLCEEDKSAGFCFREATLPDTSLIHGRMLVVAWEEGLETIEDETVTLMERAVEQLLRQMVTALVMQRGGYRLRDGRFPHAFGSLVPDPFRINTQTRLFGANGGAARPVAETYEYTVDGQPVETDPLVPTARPLIQNAERRALMEVAAARRPDPEDDKPQRPIGLLELMNLLQRDRSLIPAHSVYALNLERLISRLNQGDYIE